MVQAKATTTGKIGLYLHIPFCASTCDFCAFYQEAPERKRVEAFVRALVEEMRRAEVEEPIDTVFFGGGTPGILTEGDFEHIFAGLHRHFEFQPREITVELAPSTVRGKRPQVLQELGVTRVSLGVQSFNDTTLEKLGRRQDAKRARQAYETLRLAGFSSINIDLIFAYPGQTAEAWAADLQRAVALGPEHISTYCLTFEEDTQLWLQLREGQLRRGPEEEAARYEETWAYLPAQGYAQYEISNFARPGHNCRHNENTWRMGHWLGLGPSAASQYRGWRWANPANTEQWQQQISQGAHLTPPIIDPSARPLTPALLAEDAVLFGLRMNAGVDLTDLAQRWPEAGATLIALEAQLAEFAAAGWLEGAGRHYRLNDAGRLRVDALAAELVSTDAVHP